MQKIGCKKKEYFELASLHKIRVFRLVTVEGRCPELNQLNLSLDLMHQSLKNNENVLIHCRGGIGRASVVACAYLIRFKVVSSSQEAIRVLRELRSPRAIENAYQEHFISKLTE